MIGKVDFICKPSVTVRTGFHYLPKHLCVRSGRFYFLRSFRRLWNLLIIIRLLFPLPSLMRLLRHQVISVAMPTVTEVLELDALIAN